MLFSCTEKLSIVDRILSPQNSPGLSSFGLLSKWKDSDLYKIFIKTYKNLILKEQEKDEIFIWSEKLLKKFYKTHYYDEFKLEELEIISKQFFKEVKQNILNEDFKVKQYISSLKNPMFQNKLSKEEIEFFHDDFKKFSTKIKMEKLDSLKINDNIDLAPLNESVKTISSKELFDQVDDTIILKNDEIIYSNLIYEKSIEKVKDVSKELKYQSLNTDEQININNAEPQVLNSLKTMKSIENFSDKDNKLDNEENFLEIYEDFTSCKLNKSLNFLEYASTMILNIFVDIFEIIQNKIDKN